MAKTAKPQSTNSLLYEVTKKEHVGDERLAVTYFGPCGKVKTVHIHDDAVDEIIVGRPLPAHLRAEVLA